MRRLALAALLIAVLLLPPALPTAAQGGYLETFDQYENDVPLPFRAPNWDVLVHSRDRSTWTGLEPMQIEHGPMCEAPPAMHPSADPMPYPDAVFVCRDHLMTALKAGGYGVIYLTPAAMADFSAGEAVIRFDVSTLRASGRDWIDLWVTPYEDNLTAPLELWLPSLAGIAMRTIHLKLGSNNWEARVYRDGVEQDLSRKGWIGYQTFLTPDAARRDTVEVRLSRTRLSVCMPAYSFCWSDDGGTPIDPPLDWTRGVVQIGHHSYTPEKDCSPVGADGCRPGTWHWDNVAISPSVPFAMIRANERAMFERAQGEPLAFTFPRPAPEGSHLRVNAFGRGWQVSADGGATWEALRRQPSTKPVDASEGTHEPYWHPIPAGTTRVLLRTTISGWWGTGGVDYAAIWSLRTDAPPAATPTQAATATATATPTATSAPTNTLVPPTATITPTTGVSATATPFPGTPAPEACVVTVTKAGTPVAAWDCR